VKTSCESDSDLENDPLLTNIDKRYLSDLGDKIRNKSKHVAHQTKQQTIEPIEYAKRQKIKQMSETVMAEILLQELAEEANCDQFKLSSL
jgi:hypothetical protein